MDGAEGLRSADHATAPRRRAAPAAPFPLLDPLKGAFENVFGNDVVLPSFHLSFYSIRPPSLPS